MSSYDRILCLSTLAAVLRDQGRLSEAMEKAEQATALATTVPEESVAPGTIFKDDSLLDPCHKTEASILERMGRLQEAIAKDQLSSDPYSHGGMMRVALLAVSEGVYDAASDILRKLIALTPEGDPADARSIEGPDAVLRAKELLCQVLHRMGGADAEVVALRAELRHEEARRGEALREVRALIRRVAGLSVVPRTSRKNKKNKKHKKSKRGRRRGAATASAQRQEGEDEEEGQATEAAAAAAELPVAEEEVPAVGVGAPPMEDEGPAEEEEEEEGAEAKDDCPVCLTPLGTEEGGEEEEGVLIMCGHEFHVTCLDAWVSTCVRKRLDVTCPSCRAPVNR
jgi:tetratricopeptide (TPR) repeat protein